MTRQIQLFKPVYSTDEILGEIRQCLDRGWTGQGYKTLELEKRFKEYIGVKNAHFLNSATAGLHLALEIIKIKEGLIRGIVATTPLTFISDSHVIRHAGLQPIFVDIDEHLCMSPANLEYILGTHEYTAVAVIYVGMGGNTGKLDWVRRICTEHNVPLILDASHMMGTYYDNRHVGTEADYTVFSFQSVKNLPTADSGMLVCKSISDDILARHLSWLGINKDTYTRQTTGGNWDYNVDFIGWKYHGNSIMAAMALVQLKYLASANAIRREQVVKYAKLNSIYSHIPIAGGCMSSRHLYQVRVDSTKRNNIIKQARDKGVQLGVHYKSHQEYPMYADCKYFCPNANLASRQLISLPIGPHLTEDDVEYVIEVLNGIRV